MTIKEKTDKILPLFEQLTSLSREPKHLPKEHPLSHIAHLPRGTLFSCFHEKHLREATDLFELLYPIPDFDDFIAAAKEAREVVNEGLFVYAFSVAVVHRQDCKGVTLPPIQEVFPDRFIPAETINLAIKEAKNHPNEDLIEVEAQDTGNILDPEYKLAYFREDVGINAHHWYWHVVYPANWGYKLEGIKKDRKGELFYYMHQQMSARYDCERLSNGLNRMIPFHNFEEKLEGYAPHLTSLVSGLHYASRPQGLSLKDLPEVDVQDMERWRERILEAIDLRKVIDSDGQEINLDEEHGADLLGHIIEASSTSPNKEFYGSLHNWGHVMMARMSDPDGRFQENPGVMSDTSTSLRDPIFYRWHRFVDNIFQQYKATLEPYKKEQLSFDGIKIISTQVVAGGHNNLVKTFLTEDKLDLSHGINFRAGQKVLVKYKHLDHEPFALAINVENTSGAAKQVTFRVFLGPKYDELGNRLAPDQQRRLMIELDKFHKEVAPGTQVINRAGVESSVTLRQTYSFEDLRAGNGGSLDPNEYCSCGWPRNMLIPRGTHKGKPFELFVMATDYTVDNPAGIDVKTCRDAISYCGAKDTDYPDKKPMGFPFDRPITAKTAQELLTENMSLTEVIIKFGKKNNDH